MATNTNLSGLVGATGTIGQIGTMGSAGIQMQKCTYHILGEDVEVSGYVDGTTAMIISTLNVLGKPFYDELKKNKVSFGNEIEDYLKVKFRDIKIETILNDKNND